jgi:5'-methylthioadenosine phosphorylase
MIGIIGGTGIYDPDFLSESEKIRVETEYGDNEVILGKIGKEKAAFLSRHGSSHNIPPHKVDYRRNIASLKVSGAKRVISINSVGSLADSLPPGSVLIPHDFIDFTKDRAATFYDGEVVHVDMSEPYCKEIRKTLIECSRQFYPKVFENGVYVCTEGPRFETTSEIRMLRSLGGDVVGMVGFPEVTLAREAGLCYASICTIANYGCGISKKPLTIEEVNSIVTENLWKMKKTLECAVGKISKFHKCKCPEYISVAKV